MARTALPIQAIGANGQAIASITWTAADAANNHSFDNTSGNVFLLAKCTDASGKTVTVVSVADPYGRTGDLAIAVLATTGFAIAGPFSAGALWNQAGTGLVNVNVSAATSLSLAAVQFTD